MAETEAGVEAASGRLDEAVANGARMPEPDAPPTLEDGHSARFHEIAAEMDRYARGLLWKISDCTFISGPEVVELADDYDALRAIVLAVRAGWVTAGPDGLLITDHGRDVARRMFVDR